MRSLPLFKYGPRARSTSWAIALCTMFIVASFSVAGGLRTSMDLLRDNFSSEYSILTRPVDNGLAFFDESDMAVLDGRAAFGAFVDVEVVEEQERVVAFRVYDPHSVLRERLSVSEHQVLAGVSSSLAGNLTLRYVSSVSVLVDGKYSSSMFSSSWLLVGEGVMNELTAHPELPWNFCVAKSMTAEMTETLEEDGYVVQPMIGIIEFLDSSISELEQDAYWILIPSSFVIAVLAYSFIGAEVSDRRHDIGIIKTIGAGRKRILYYLITESALISAWGGVLGLALGIVLSYAVSTIASAAFTSVFVIEIQEPLLIVSFLTTVAAGIAGAVIPSVKMTVTRPVSDLTEASP